MSTKTKAFLWLIVTFPVLGLVLFLSAGTAAWFAGWIYLAFLCAFSVANNLWLLRNNPGLLEERIRFNFQETWDKSFLAAFYVLFSVWFILMPLDAVRFHWSRMPVWLHTAGAVILVFSFYIFFLTFRENPYVSTAVRVQEDRGQRVVTTGPYRHVRHPMYAGAFLYLLGTSLLLGSWYGVLFEPIFVIMIAVRAVLEERLLRKKLKGYKDYMAKVKYRFIPHIW
jgi:protein-S-isoprenylcysteine O-methyltransferase Ste14